MYVFKQQDEMVWAAPVTGSGACGNGPEVHKGQGW
jgi:hypothetical protein